MLRFSGRGLVLPVFAFAAFAAHTASAQNFCYVPNPPYCASRFGSFDDEWEFDRCRREVEAFRDQSRTYVQCLQQERDAAVQKVNDAVEAFNRKARRLP